MKETKKITGLNNYLTIETIDNKEYINKRFNNELDHFLMRKNQYTFLKWLTTHEYPFIPKAIEFKNNHVLFKKVNGETFWQLKDFSKHNLDLIVKAIKDFQTIKIDKNDYTIFDLKEIATRYKKLANEDLIDHIDWKYIEEKTNENNILAHNDLNAANIIKDDQRIYLIDFDYIGLAHPYSDITNFITKCYLNDEEIEYTKNKYFENDNNVDYKLYNEMIGANYYTWHFWARAMLKEKNGEIFKKALERIANDKKEQYFAWLKKYKLN